MHWEVEQKFRLTDREALVRLEQLGVTFSSGTEQVDRYFNHPSRDFAQTDEAFRIRSVGERNFLTYKGPKIDPHTKTRRETELPLGDGAAVASQLAEVLTTLGFRPAGTVRKSRQTGTLSWEQQEVEVVLDQVEGLGAFLELEISTDDSGLESCKKALHRLALHLGLSSPERRSYLELILSQGT